jgi:hypothetical protein
MSHIENILKVIDKTMTSDISDAKKLLVLNYIRNKLENPNYDMTIGQVIVIDTITSEAINKMEGGYIS